MHRNVTLKVHKLSILKDLPRLTGVHEHQEEAGD